MIEFKTQQKILPEDELPIATEETKTVGACGTHSTGGWERMYFHERVALASEDKKGVLAKDGIITFQDVLIVWIHNVALVADPPAVRDRLKEQTVFNFGRWGRQPL
jgi:hypothetical protein